FETGLSGQRVRVDVAAIGSGARGQDARVAGAIPQAAGPGARLWKTGRHPRSTQRRTLSWLAPRQPGNSVSGVADSDMVPALPAGCASVEFKRPGPLAKKPGKR